MNRLNIMFPNSPVFLLVICAPGLVQMLTGMFHNRSGFPGNLSGSLLIIDPMKLFILSPSPLFTGGYVCMLCVHTFFLKILVNISQTRTYTNL